MAQARAPRHPKPPAAAAPAKPAAPAAAAAQPAEAAAPPPDRPQAQAESKRGGGVTFRADGTQSREGTRVLGQWMGRIGDRLVRVQHGCPLDGLPAQLVDALRKSRMKFGKLD